MEAVHTSTHDDSSGIPNETSDMITWKLGTKQDKQGLIPGHPAPPPSLNLSIRVNPEVIKEVVHHAGLHFDGSLHLCLHVCKVIHTSLESSDPFHRALSLVNPITDVPLQRSIPVRVPSRGGVSGSG
jgi:hypothetical protein